MVGKSFTVAIRSSRLQCIILWEDIDTYCEIDIHIGSKHLYTFSLFRVGIVMGREIKN